MLLSSRFFINGHSFFGHLTTARLSRLLLIFALGMLVFHRCRRYILVMLPIILDCYFWPPTIGHPSMWSFTSLDHQGQPSFWCCRLPVGSPHNRCKSHFSVTENSHHHRHSGRLVVIAGWVGTFVIIGNGCWGSC